MTAATFTAVVAFAASTGIATFFAPCAFPLLPGYIGYYVGQSDDGTPQMAVSAAAAAGGALAAISVIAGAAFVVGRSLTAALPVLEPIVGIILIVFGVLTLTGQAPTVDVALPARPDSTAGFTLFGAIYAIAAAGCVGPLFLGVLTQALAFTPAKAVIVLSTYALAVALPLVGVTILANVGVEEWREIGGYTGYAKQFAASMMVVAGIGQVYLSVAVLDVL
ncbi:cytochrome C biogenesis protein [halophilic archaeon]|nr:cytochrome C biogenesis protein [halophilic archaeon]